MAIVYVTTDLARWGVGTGVPNPAATVDLNFWQVHERIAILEALPGAAAGIEEFVIEGDELTVIMDDYTTRGPYTLPIWTPTFRGEWEPETDYFRGDILTANGSTYFVLADHTSALTFDPNANNGSGQDYYGVLLENPAATLPAGGAAGMALVKSTANDYEVTWSFAVLPAGGATGQVLRKVSGTDYDVEWVDFGIDELTDVVLLGPANGDILVYNASDQLWVNTPLSIAGLSPGTEHQQILRWDAVTQDYLTEHPRQIATESGTTATLSSTHIDAYVRCTNAAGCTVTIPPVSTFTADTPYIGMEIHLRAVSGPIIFSWDDSAVTLNGIQGFAYETDRDGAVVTLKYVAENEWDLFGLLAEAAS